MNNNLILEKLNANSYFSLYTCCIPVKGKKRGVIYDLQRGEMHYVPNIILDILNQYSSNDILDNYDENEREGLIEALNYLFDNDLIFFTNTELSRFPTISETINEIPDKIDFLSIEIEAYPTNYSVLDKIDSYGVSELMMIQSDKKDMLENLKEMLNSLTRSIVQNITLILPNGVYSTLLLNKLIEDNLRLNKIIIFDSKEKSINNENEIVYTNEGLKETLCKRITNINDFIINTSSYIESKNRNLYFNKRVYIDRNGYVKHSYDDDKVYGSINHLKLETIVFSADFEELFKITKDYLDECKKCEFRYICPDNRIPNKISKYEYKHATRCNYNPKTTLWNE